MVMALRIEKVLSEPAVIERLALVTERSRVEKCHPPPKKGWLHIYYCYQRSQGTAQVTSAIACLGCPVLGLGINPGKVAEVCMLWVSGGGIRRLYNSRIGEGDRRLSGRFDSGSF